LARLTKYLFLSLGLCFYWLPCAHGQEDPVDSLNRLLKNARTDTLKLRLLVELSEECENKDILRYTNEALKLADKILANETNEETKTHTLKHKADALNNAGFELEIEGNQKAALEAYAKSLKIREEIKDSLGIANSYNNMGFVYDKHGEIQKALASYAKSLQLRVSINDKEGMARTFNNIAVIFNKQGNIPQALNFLVQSLKMREEVGDKGGTARTLNNIAQIYKNQGDVETALEYYKRSIKIAEEAGEKQIVSYTLHNIGVIHFNKGDLDQALAYYLKSLRMREEIGDKQGIAHSLYNLSLIYVDKGDLPKALDHNLRSLAITRKINDREGQSAAYNNIANIYLAKGKYKLAAAYSDSSLTRSRQLGFPQLILNSEKTMSLIDSAKGNFTEAFEHYKQYIIYKDSIENESTRKASTRSQLNYEYEKKEAVMKEAQEKEQVVAREKSRFQLIVIWAVAGGLLLVILFAIVAVRSLRVTHRQKMIIQEKQREILDSIHYARRIQTAIITNERYIQKNLTRLQK